MPPSRPPRVTLAEKFAESRKRYLEDLLRSSKARRIKESVERLPDMTNHQRMKLFNNFVAFYRTRAALRSACDAIEMPLSLQRKLVARLLSKKGKLLASDKMPGVDSVEVRHIVFDTLHGHLSEPAWDTFRREWIDFDKRMSVIPSLDLPLSHPKKRSDSPRRK